VIQYLILTHLPSFEVVDTRRTDTTGSHPLVEYSKFDIYDYEDALDKRVPPHGPYKLREVQVDDPQKVRFDLFDTPGLNDTDGNDEIHMANIFDELKRAGSIHLVLLVVGQGPFSPGFRNAIRCYLEVFPQLQEIMAIVHTRTDYKYLHQDDSTGFNASSAAKVDKLHEIIGRKNFPHFWIDCDLASVKAIRKCMTFSLIQKILKVAMYNQPISFRSTTMKKTPTVRAIDQLMEDKYGYLSKSLANTLQHKGEVQENQVFAMFQLREEIARNESEQENVGLGILELETDNLELLDEIRIEDNWGHFRLVHPDTVALKEQGFTIDILNMEHTGFDLSDQRGGGGIYMVVGSVQKKELRERGSARSGLCQKV